MTRRKSKPLMNQDVDVSLLSSQEHRDYTVQPSFSTYTSSQQHLSSSQSSRLASQPSLTETCAQACTDTPLLTAEIAQASPENALDTNLKIHKETCPTSKVGIDSEVRSRAPGGLFRSLSQTAIGKRQPGYFANRRSASFIIHDDHGQVPGPSKTLSAQDSTVGHSGDAISEPRPPLSRTSSLVKLSMDAEGNAEIQSRTGDTPSPPHARPILLTQSAARPSSGLQRSFSAVEPSSNVSVRGSFPSRLGQRKVAGRSRDARMWEFYCDSEARNALTEQAEREETGSAAAAIGLIRSSSQKAKNLTTNPNKRNAHIQKSDTFKRHKTENEKPSKPKFGRAASSVARLQTTNADSQKPKAAKSSVKHRKSDSQPAIFEDFEGDSDKENWEPGTQNRQVSQRRRPVTSQESARVLLESLREPSQSSSLGSSLSRGSTTMTENKENNSGPEGIDDDEVVAFMGENPLPREEEDLDCVQNLLRLSQAAWE